MLQSADMFGFPCVEYLKMTYICMKYVYVKYHITNMLKEDNFSIMNYKEPFKKMSPFFD